MADVRTLLRAFVALIAILLCPLVYAQGPAGKALTSVSRNYREVDFRGQFLHRTDSRFIIAANGLIFRSGVMLESRDPAIHNLRWFDGTLSSGLLRDGRALVLWPSLFTEPLVAEVRVAPTAELAGQEMSRFGPGRPADTHPTIRGYRYVASANLVGTGDYLGIWQRTGGSAETLVVSFRPSDPAPYRRVGTVPLRLNSLFISSPRHNISWDVTFTSDAPAGRPLYILHYVWMPAYFRPLASSNVAATR